MRKLTKPQTIDQNENRHRWRELSSEARKTFLEYRTIISISEALFELKFTIRILAKAINK